MPQDDRDPLPIEKQNKSYMWIEPTPPPEKSRAQRKAAPPPKITRPQRKMPPVQNVMPRTRMTKA